MFIDKVIDKENLMFGFPEETPPKIVEEVEDELAEESCFFA